jgi:hypothetical protein
MPKYGITNIFLLESLSVTSSSLNIGYELVLMKYSWHELESGHEFTFNLQAVIS